MLPAIENGFFQQEIADASYRHQQELERGERDIVALSKYNNHEPIRIPILEMDPEGYDKQVARLNRVRQERDQQAAQDAIDALRDACANDKNVMPYLIDAAKAYVTLGEMTDVMREVFGLYQEPLHI